jgi:hypothetical protein
MGVMVSEDCHSSDNGKWMKIERHCAICSHKEEAWSEEIADLRMDWHVKREHNIPAAPKALIAVKWDELRLSAEDKKFLKDCGISNA